MTKKSIIVKNRGKRAKAYDKVQSLWYFYCTNFCASHKLFRHIGMPIRNNI